MAMNRETINTELRAIVTCLLTAHYSECEIVDYLKGPLGVPEEDAIRAVDDAAGTTLRLNRHSG
jgi:hypothetical protein